MGRKLTQEEFKTKAINKYGNRFIYPDEYINNSTAIRIICQEHGNFWQRPKDHLDGHSCPECAGVKPLTKESFSSKANGIHNNIYNYDDVVINNARTKVLIKCHTHGYFWQKPNDHLTGKGCPDCGGTKLLTKELFCSRARLIHDNFYIYDNVVIANVKTKVCIVCPRHGAFWQVPESHLNGHGCPKCQAIYKQNKWLDSLGLPDDNTHREVVINIDMAKYKVDGYNPITHTIYEFNGDYWHGNPAKYSPTDINPRAKKTYGELYSNTVGREKIIKEAGYNVISIWESDWDKLRLV